MTPDDLLRALRHRWWWLAIGAAVGLACAVLALLVLPNRYTAETALMVEARPAAGTEEMGVFDDVTAVEDRLPTLVSLAASDANHERIVQELGSDVNRDQLDSDLEYSFDEGSTILIITAEGDSPEQAQSLASAASAATAETITEASSASIELSAQNVREPVAPSSPSSPDTLVVLPAGLIAGLLVAVLAVLLVPMAGAGRARR